MQRMAMREFLVSRRRLIGMATGPALAALQAYSSSTALASSRGTPRYPWAVGLRDDEWVEHPGTNFYTWAAGGGITPDSYLPQNLSAISSIVQAYSAPAIGADMQRFFGGGHADGSYNGICELNHKTLAWREAVRPTPRAKYPPDYIRNFGKSVPMAYPSGVPFNGWFLGAYDLVDPADAAYVTTKAPRVPHTYGAAVMRGNSFLQFCAATSLTTINGYAECDLRTGRWSGWDVHMAEQLKGFRKEYGSTPLQQGTMAHYDLTTDRVFITLNPGDAGGSWRSAMMVWNPATRTIQAVLETNHTSYGLILNSISLIAVGRRLYGFLKPSAVGAMNAGFILDMDAAAVRTGLVKPADSADVYKRFVVSGHESATTLAPSAGQETIPAWYDGRAIRRWNYGSADHRGTIISVDPEPVSGTGSRTDPFVLRQTARMVPRAPANGVYLYRIAFVPGADRALVLPRANSNLFSLRLS